MCFSIVALVVYGDLSDINGSIEFCKKWENRKKLGKNVKDNML